MIDPIFRTETNRGLQPQMAARRIRNVPATMTVTEGILSSSLSSETFKAHPISQCHLLRPQRDSTVDLNYLSNPRQVRPRGATSTRAHCCRHVSKRKHNSTACAVDLRTLPRCVETAFLKWIRRSDEDVLSTIFFTILLGSFAWPVWSNLQRVRCQLYEVFGKLEALQQSIEVIVVSPRVRAGS